MDAGEGASTLHPLTAFVRDRTTLVLYAALGAFATAQVVPSLVAPSLRAELGYSYLLTSTHLSAFAAGSVVAGLVGVPLTRRLGRTRVLSLGLVGAAAGTLGLTAGRSAWATLLACLLTGALGTLVMVAVQAGLADHHGERRVVAFAESNVVASTGATLAPLVVGLLTVATGSWRWGVAAIAALALVVAALARTTHVTTLAEHPQDAPRAALSGRARAAVGLVFCSVLLEFSVSFWGATYLTDVVGMAATTAVTAMVCFFGAMLVGRAAGAVLSRRVAADLLVRVALTVAGCGLLLGALTTATPWVLVALVLLGLGVSVLFPLGLSLAIAAAPRASALVSGRCVTSGALAALLGPLLIGQAADEVGLRPALLVLPLAVAGAVVLLRLTAGAVPVAPAARAR